MIGAINQSGRTINTKDVKNIFLIILKDRNKIGLNYIKE